MPALGLGSAISFINLLYFTQLKPVDPLLPPPCISPSPPWRTAARISRDLWSSNYPLMTPPHGRSLRLISTAGMHALFLLRVRLLGRRHDISAGESDAAMLPVHAAAAIWRLAG